MARYGRDFEHRNWLARAGDAVERWFGGRDDYDRDFRGGAGMDRGRFDEEGRFGRQGGMGDAGWHGARGGYDRDYGGMDYRGGYGSGFRRDEMVGGMQGGSARGFDRGGWGEMRARGSWQGDGYRSTNRDMARDRFFGAGRGDRPGYGGELSDVDYGRDRQSRAFRGGGLGRDSYGGGQRGGYRAGGGEMDRDEPMRTGYGDYGPYPGSSRFRGGGAGGVPSGRYFTGYGGTNFRSGSSYEPLG
jgi:hypothetical protein